jgi:hypothetical protein
MQIRVTVTPAELEEMDCETIAELVPLIRCQLDDAISSDDGCNGKDWMPDYELEVVLSEANA